MLLVQLLAMKNVSVLKRQEKVCSIWIYWSLRNVDKIYGILYGIFFITYLEYNLEYNLNKICIIQI